MTIRLGLIGGNIAASRAPDLHQIAGQLAGIDIRYDRYVPKDLGMSFSEALEDCRRQGLVGVNVTHPYKEEALKQVTTDARVQLIGAINTVIFHQQRLIGYNTDFTGFISAFRSTFGARNPGHVTVFGAGGAGRAVTFGLAELGASSITLIDTESDKADRLAADLIAIGATAQTGDVAALTQTDGVVNCTALGMTGNTECVIQPGQFPRDVWAFDAVYTPLNTPFRAAATDAGAAFMSGFELFFFQGLDAFQLFTGCPVEQPETLRAALT